jgi:enoyl-CoA hydratase
MHGSDPRIDLALGDIARLTIRRADKLNALDGPMITALRDACQRVEQSTARVLILTGDGGRAFSAGGDIAAWSDLSPDAFSQGWVRDGHTAMNALTRLRQPVIAVLNGHALGGGLELAACADLRIAEAHITIGQPETGLGIIPGWSGTQRAVQRFGGQVVRRMAIFGEVFSADQALSLGLVDQVVPTGQGLQAADTVAQHLLTKGTRATELTKMLINAAMGEDRERVLESLASGIAAASDELAQGLAAFRAKRKPEFGGQG